MEIVSYKKMIIDVIKLIEKNTALFYQQKNKEGYEMFDNTLTLLIKTTDGILASQKEKGGLYIDERELNTILANAMNAMESGDSILLSDILYFDLQSLLKKSLQLLVHNEMGAIV